MPSWKLFPELVQSDSTHGDLHCCWTLVWGRSLLLRHVLSGQRGSEKGGDTVGPLISRLDAAVLWGPAQGPPWVQSGFALITARSCSCWDVRAACAQPVKDRQMLPVCCLLEVVCMEALNMVITDGALLVRFKCFLALTELPLLHVKVMLTFGRRSLCPTFSGLRRQARRVRARTVLWIPSSRVIEGV